MGSLQIVTYESKATGATRQAYVYTPPDYGRTNTKYPVLYLLHGGGDLDPGWSMTGRAHIIMDNLIAEKKARPMIVVMPLARGGGSLGLGPSGMSPGISGGRQRRAGAADAVRPRPGAAAAPAPAPLQPFAQDFIGDLMPARREDLPRVDSSGGSRDRRICRPAARRRSTPHSAVPICSATWSS